MIAPRTYNQGQSTAEARFELALGFDFMSEYTAISTDLLSIQATINNTSDGFEIFFVSSAYTREANEPIPEPNSAVLMALGFVALTLLENRRRKTRSD
jgi:hypothetical protein